MQKMNCSELFMSPLDDPVFGAIFANAEVAIPHFGGYNIQLPIVPEM